MLTATANSGVRIVCTTERCTTRLENPALSTVTIRITQLLCVRTHSLELTSNSRSLLLSPPEN